MALTKTPVNINFASGLDTKTDPFQVPPGRFLSLHNTVFNTGGRLQKRNGYGGLTPLPNNTNTFLTTFNDNLTAIGTTLYAYSAGSGTWINKGEIKPIQLDVLPLIRSNTNQSQSDTAVAPNGLICTVYTDNVPVMGTNVPVYKYAVADSITGQNIVAPTELTNAEGAPRVFVLNTKFVIVFSALISATHHLQYLAINIAAPAVTTAYTDISTSYTPAATIAFDGVVVNNNLYLAWNGNDGGGAIRLTYIDSTLQQHNTVVFAGHSGTRFSVTADSTLSTPVIYVSFWTPTGFNGYTLAVNQQLNTVFTPQQIINNVLIANLTSSAANSSANILYEVVNTYSYDGAILTDYIRKINITQAGSVGSPTTLIRSVGLASKAFEIDGTEYVLTSYESNFQPTYFLIDFDANIIAKLAYSNAGGLGGLGLPSVTISGTVAKMSYLIKDLITTVNKSQGAANVAGVYSQTGINLVSFELDANNVISSEIGNNLHISGGFLWMYDGYVPVEHGFFVWPDNVEVTTSGAGGLITAQQYFYQVTYEWTDNQGNVHRSAPSIPISITTAGATSSNTIYVPTLRLTYKTANPVKIVIYRWSTAQQTYYQVTSLLTPLLNDTSVDSVSYVDILADSAIIGNSIIYTTGGVVENIGAPSASALTLFQSRLFLIDAEDKNLLWYSKQVIETTPVEMSDLFTQFIAPTASAQGSTGPMRALSALDDKLIIFKKDAIYYINGAGPDNTGANNQFSEPIFITATAGSDNQQSIVFMPNGLMFESDKGIWLLGRDLSTSYIGAPVEQFTQNATVQSAVNVPGTNQVRFTLDSGITLMYDYYYQQWGSFTNVPARSSTLYQGLHSYINSYGQVFQETINKYLDGSSPVLISFQSGWLNLAGLQGFQRAYYFYLLGTYISPHKLTISIAYDYASAPSQTMVISPDNYNGAYGSDPLYGNGNPYGGNSTLEQWRIFFSQQKCESFQISLQESFDSTKDMNPAGAGLTISGLDLVVGIKKGYTTLKASRSIG